MREAAHLLRLLALLLAGAALFALVRQQLVPDGFGKYGHYRAGALDDARSRPIVHGGRETCLTCHDDEAKVLLAGKHGPVGCESCHGAAARHAEDPGASKPALPDTATLCARCHEQNAARPKTFPQVESKEHSGGEACKSCHEPHGPKVGG